MYMLHAFQEILIGLHRAWFKPCISAETLAGKIHLPCLQENLARNLIGSAVYLRD
jgi:hypothetical protein